MWSSDAYRNQVSILALTASDAAYRDIKTLPFVQGEPLRSFPDSKPQDEYQFPLQVLGIPARADQASPVYYEPKSLPSTQGGLVEGVEFKNWTFVEKVQRDDTGFGLVVYKRDYQQAGQPKSEYIIAVQGTDGRNGQDWYANIQVAKNQWDNILSALFGANGTISRLASPDGTRPILNFTGQSLGGGLAQYLAYEWVREKRAEALQPGGPAFDPSTVTLTTFNGFAGALGARQIFGPQAYDRKMLHGVATAHYTVENDVVHRVGAFFENGVFVEGHLNGSDGGQSNMYHFADWRHWDGLAEKSGSRNFLGLVEGHRIESAFYQGLDRYIEDFTAAKRGGNAAQYIDVERLQEIGEVFARLLGGDRSTKVSAWARVTSAVAMVAVLGPIGEMASLFRLLGTSLYNSEDINAFTKALIASEFGSLATAGGIKLLAKPLLLTAGVSALIAGIADRIGKGALSQEAVDFFNRNTTSDVSAVALPVNTGFDGASLLGEKEAAQRFDLLLAYLNPESIADPRLVEIATTLGLINDDPIEFATTLYESADSMPAAMAYLASKAKTALNDDVEVARFAGGLIAFMGNDIRRIALGNQSDSASLATGLTQFVRDYSVALANANQDFISSKTTGISDVTTRGDWQSIRSLVDAGLDAFKKLDFVRLFGISSANAGALASELKDARNYLIASGEAVEITPGASSNPFNSADSDPSSASSVSSSTVTDGGANSYTVFLPYAAQSGGQHLRMKLEGAAADKLSAIAGGQTLTMTNGEFDLTITEGQRALTFALLSNDSVTTNTDLTLSATLTDAAGNATHLTHNELNLTLMAPADAVTADQVFTNTVLGDQDAADFDDNLGGTEANDKIIAGQGDDVIGAFDGKDWILGGMGRDSLFGDAGNDLIEGGAGSDLLAGGSEDDQIYADSKGDRAAAMNSDATEPGAESDWLDGFDGNDLLVGGTGADVLTGGAGTDVLIGGAGNDSIYGDAQTAFSSTGNVIHGEVSDVSLEGSDDTLFGGGGDDFMRGEVGNDALFGGAGNDRLFGDADSLAVNFHGDDYLDGGVGNDILEGQGGNDGLIGGDGDDQLFGDSDALALTAHGDDYLEGGAGNDFLRGMGGIDILAGGAGDDELQGDEGADELYGDDGIDTMHGGAGDDYLDGGAGNDFMNGGDGADGLFGGEGDDQVRGGAGDDQLDGEEGDDVLLGDAGADTLFGAAGNDQLQGGAGDDSLYGEAGDDVLFGDDGNDTLLGDEGKDQLQGGAGDDSLDGEAGDDFLLGDDGNDTLSGGEGTDQLQGGGGDDALDGEEGDDVLFGEAGKDTLDGGDGNDQLSGDDGDDILRGGAGDDVLVGGAGDDILEGGLGNDGLAGGAGKDTYIFNAGQGAEVIQDVAAGSSDASVVIFGEGIAQGDLTWSVGANALIADFGGGNSIAFIDFNPRDPDSTRVFDELRFADGSIVRYQSALGAGWNMEGTEENDNITGGRGQDRIDGKAGDDHLIGGADDDTILGGLGRDTIKGGEGNDSISGGDGADVIEGETGDDSLQGGEGDDILNGGEGNDAVDGGAGKDFIDAGAGDNTVDGGGDDDTIKAGAGNDRLAGDAGNDTLTGGSGDDTLTGGVGDDVLVGGAGSDTYVYNLGDEQDRITDLGGDPDDVDTLSFGPGIGLADVALSRTQRGDLEARLAGGGLVTIPFMYSDTGANRIERIVFADGTVLGRAALDALPENLIIGSGAADVLIGSGGSDTLDGRGGEDFLDGKEGADTLIGGAGNDRYRLGFRTQRDVVLENAGEVSTVELEGGLSLLDVNAVGAGDNLVISLRGTENALTFAGFFSGGQQASVVDAQGNSATIQELLTATTMRAGSRDELKEDFRRGARSYFFANQIEAGLHLIDPSTNTFQRRDYSNVLADYIRQAMTITRTDVVDGRPHTTKIPNNGEFWRITKPADATTLRAIFDDSIIVSDDAEIRAPDAEFQRILARTPVKFSWETLASSTSEVHSQGFENVVDPKNYSIINIDLSAVSTSVLGIATDAPAGYTPPPPPPAGSEDGTPVEPFPEGGFVFDDISISTLHFGEVLAGPSDNTIYNAVIADGGAGNDFIVGGRLALGGDGDDRIEGAANQYGEDGNDRLIFGDLLDGGAGDDVLRNGKVMQPGSGTDLMVGWDGANVFRVGAGDGGAKLIFDIGIDFFTGEEDEILVHDIDVVELQSAISFASLSVSLSALELDSELGQELQDDYDVLDLSWGTDTIARIVLANSFNEQGTGIEQVVLGDGTVLTIEELVALVPANTITGTEDDEDLFGTSVRDFIFGLGGSDFLDGARGDDTLVGGSGDDFLFGGFGDDTYLFEDGFGSDSIRDRHGFNRIKFAGSLVSSDIVVARRDTDLTFTAGQDSIFIRDWFDSSENRISEVEFADGVVWDADTVEANRSLGIPSGDDDYLEGTPGADVIDGLGGDDDIFGYAGDDALSGGEGEDSIEGGAGDDVIEGGEGDDSYFFATEGNDIARGGDGFDDLEDTEGHNLLDGGADDDFILGGTQNFLVGGGGDDVISSAGAGSVVAFNTGDGNDAVFFTSPLTLSLGGGLTPANLALSLLGDDLLLTAGPSDSIRLVGGFGADAQTWPSITLQMFGSVHAYDFNAVIADFAAALAGDPSLTTFALGGVLESHETSVSQTGALGGALAWQYAMTGSTSGLSASQIQGVLADPDFGVAVQPISLGSVNHAPLLDHAVGNRATTEYLPFSLSVAEVFSDADPGDSLAYTATLSSGDPLPAWLNFDRTTQTFSGMPEAVNLGTYRIRVTATDIEGLSASTAFRLVVAATPDQTIIGTDADDILVSHSGNDRLDGGLGADMMTGGRGHDTYVVDNRNDQVIENPNEGIDAVESSASFALSANVENLTLTGDADIDGTGNSSRNKIVGNSGANIIDGGGGADTMVGGSGDDTYVVNAATDVVVEDPEDGIDTVRSSISYSLSANVENLVLTGTGGLRGTGNDLANAITGNSAGNTLDGGAGADTLIGGLGNDTYVIDDAGDAAIENAGEGTDTVKTSVSYALAENLENLVLTGTVGITGTGNAANNVLTGNAAPSTLAGGTGNDTYIIDYAGVSVLENPDEGTDLVKSSVTYALSDNVENLTLTGTDAIDGSGNALNNVLVGNIAANVLSGGDGNDTLNGGSGADILIGGAGNDTYVIDNESDVIFENPSEGTDLVKASVSYVLADNVENLTLTGTDSISGTGNALNNVLTGNAGANVLSGGAGDDTYVISGSADTIVENADEGIDLVKSAVDYTLGDNLEKLTLTGSADLNGFGNALDNVIAGNSGSNLLEGMAGNDTLSGNLANDVLQGGAGNDTLRDNGGSNLLDGGSGNDALVGNAGNEMFVGGSGNDTVNTGTGADLIAFNRGDGQDTVAASQGADNTLSLGGGIRYEDLTFKKSGSALILQVGVNTQTGISEQITFNGWYSTTADNRSIARLQVITEAMASFDPASGDPLLVQKIQTFSFLDLVNAFDAARAVDPKLTAWALASALSQNRLAGSDTDAAGGYLAYTYGRNGTFAGVGLEAARQTLGAAGFGVETQAITQLFEGGEGDDSFRAGSSNSLLSGGTGDDSLVGGDGNDFFAGDTGDDVIDTGAGANVIAFNAGGGSDIVMSASGAVNTLSMGGGIDYEHLSLAKEGDDLILNAGENDRLLFKDWYGGKDNVANLQMIIDATAAFDATSSDPLRNSKVQTFDFRGLVSAFDEARAQSPGLSSWAVTNALLQFHLSGADDAALGGDLAYWYGKNGSLDGISLQAAQQTIGAPGFGSDAQTLRPFEGLQEGLLRLS